MPDAPTVLLFLTPAGPDPAAGRAEFHALELHAPAGTLGLAGPGATLDQLPGAGPSGIILVGVLHRVAYGHFERDVDGRHAYEVDPAEAGRLLAYLADRGWVSSGRSNALETAWHDGHPITAPMLMTAPAAAPPTSPDHGGDQVESPAPESHVLGT